VAASVTDDTHCPVADAEDDAVAGSCLVCLNSCKGPVVTLPLADPFPTAAIKLAAVGEQVFWC
jgi:hypothetical protein